MIHMVLAAGAVTVEVTLTGVLDHHQVLLTILGAITSQQQMLWINALSRV